MTDRCVMQPDSPSGPHTSHSLGPKLRRSRLRLGRPSWVEKPFHSKLEGTTHTGKGNASNHAVALQIRHRPRLHG